MTSYSKISFTKHKLEPLGGVLSDLECLTKVRERALATKATVHGPRFGAGLAGGQWDLIADTIKSELSNHDVPVFIYDLEASDA